MEKSLWDLAVEQTELNKDENSSSEEAATVFVIGSKNAGKTSLILRFLDRDEPPKPTVALEYTFGRRTKGHNIAKDVGHIWELGGGTWLSKLMEIPINVNTIMYSTLFLVLDLSTPGELWFIMDTLLQAAKSRINEVVEELKAKDPYIKDKLRTRALERIGEEHQDKSLMEPSLIPLVIVGSKYDAFQEFDSEKRKIICKTLRFLAHTHGASLQFFSIKQEQLVSKMRALVSHCLFGTNASKSFQVDHNKPIIVPAGNDSLQEIGTPPLSDGDIGRIQAKNPFELWKVAFTSCFPQTSANNPATVEDPGKDPQFTEAAIDTLRSQKDEELERYRKLAERREREAQQNNFAMA